MNDEAKATKQIADLQRVLECPITEEEDAVFIDMLEWMRRGAQAHACLSATQAEWLAAVLERHSPSYENLISSGKVPNVSSVRSMVGHLAKRPPGCR